MRVAIAVHIEAHPDITLARLQDRFVAEHQARLSDGAVWSAVGRLGLSFKINTSRSRARPSGRGRPPEWLVGGPGQD